MYLNFTNEFHSSGNVLTLYISKKSIKVKFETKTKISAHLARVTCKNFKVNLKQTLEVAHIWHV